MRRNAWRYGLHYGKRTDDAQTFRRWLQQLLVGGNTLKAPTRTQKKMRKNGVGFLTYRYMESYYDGDINGQLAARSSARDVIDAWLQVSHLHLKDPIETPVAF